MWKFWLFGQSGEKNEQKAVGNVGNNVILIRNSGGRADGEHLLTDVVVVEWIWVCEVVNLLDPRLLPSSSEHKERPPNKNEESKGVEERRGSGDSGPKCCKSWR